MADPPWPERGGGVIKRGADRHYALLSVDAIAELLRTDIVPLADQDAHLWLWVTNNYLRDGLDIIQTLGFRYVTNLAWIKDRIGLGQYLRGQHELCLLAVRGRAHLPLVRDVPSVVHCARGRHSQKPQAAFDAIERVSPGPRLEVFARNTRSGWDAWGDQVERTLFA